MFVGPKSEGGAGVEGLMSTSRQTDFNNESQNKQAASNKHVLLANALKCPS